MSNSLPLTFEGLRSMIESQIILLSPTVDPTNEWEVVGGTVGTCKYPIKDIGSDGFPNGKGRCPNGYKTGNKCYRTCADKLNNAEWTEVSRNKNPGQCINRTHKMTNVYTMASTGFQMKSQILFTGIVDAYFDDVNYLFYATCSTTILLYDIHIGFEYKVGTSANLLSSTWRCDPLDPPPHSDPTYLHTEQLTNQNFTLYIPIRMDLSTKMKPDTIIPRCMFGPTPPPGSIPQYITRPPCPTMVVVKNGISTSLPSCNLNGLFPNFPECPVPTAAPRPPLIQSEIISCTLNPINLKFKSRQLNSTISFFDYVYDSLIYSAGGSAVPTELRRHDKIRTATESVLESIGDKIYKEIVLSLTSMKYAVTVACPN